MKDIVIAEPVVFDLQERLGCKNVFSWIENEALKLTKYSSGSTIRVNLSRRIFEQRGVRTVQVVKGLAQTATITYVESGYSIQYPPGLPPERLRFSLAHELGHTLFFRPNGQPVSALQSHSVRTIEGLCDYFARSFLLPRARVTRRLAQLGHVTAHVPPIHLTPTLARDFGVAEQAVARRLVFDFSGDFYAAVCITDNGENEGQEDWRTNWCAVSAESAKEMPTGWRIPLDTGGRKIPSDMVPVVPCASTRVVSLDGRWYSSVIPQSRADSRRWLSRISPAPFRPGVVGGALIENTLLSRGRKRYFVAVK